MTTPIQEFLIKRGGSYDLSAKLRAWRDARGDHPRHYFSALARAFPLDESIVIDWSLPSDRHRHRDVPAKRIPRLAELLGMTVEALLDGVELPLAPAVPTPEPSPPPPMPLPRRNVEVQETALRAARSRVIVTHEAIVMGPSPPRCPQGHYACLRTHPSQRHALVAGGSA